MGYINFDNIFIYEIEYLDTEENDSLSKLQIIARGFDEAYKTAKEIAKRERGCDWINYIKEVGDLFAGHIDSVKYISESLEEELKNENNDNKKH